MYVIAASNNNNNNYLLFERFVRNNQNATFIVLPSRNDVFADDMGVWKHTGSPSQYFQVKTTESGDLHELVSLGKKHPTEMSHGVYHIKKNYSCHHGASDLSHTVIFIEGMYIKMAHAQLNDYFHCRPC